VCLVSPPSLSLMKMNWELADCKVMLCIIIINRKMERNTRISLGKFLFSLLLPLFQSNARVCKGPDLMYQDIPRSY
jgi:hypothetical protein